MVPPPPPPLSDELPCWWDEVWASPVDVRRRIFCNRSLNMQHIKVPALLPCSPCHRELYGPSNTWHLEVPLLMSITSVVGVHLVLAVSVSRQTYLIVP